jgi:hypothetical protein
MRRIALALLLYLCAPFVQAAPCPPRTLTPPGSVHLAGDTLMIVTHATSYHDARFAAKRGVDEAVRFARDNKIPLVYLQDDSGDDFYYMEDCRPDYWVYSQGGELGFDFKARHIYVVGGHLELCLSATLHDILEIWARRPGESFTLTFLMDGIYTNGKLVDPGDSFYEDFQRFMSVIMYGRPQGEHWPKLTLLETMGVIAKEEHEFDYLKQALPHYARTMTSNYRVELQLNDSVVKVLRPAEGWHPPTLRFHFIDSALNISTRKLFQ